MVSWDPIQLCVLWPEWCFRHKWGRLFTCYIFRIRLIFTPIYIFKQLQMHWGLYTESSAFKLFTISNSIVSIWIPMERLFIATVPLDAEKITSIFMPSVASKLVYSISKFHSSRFTDQKFIQASLNNLGVIRWIVRCPMGYRASPRGQLEFPPHHNRPPWWGWGEEGCGGMC